MEKPTYEELVKALATALDGVEGYLSERGSASPYWIESEIVKARKILEQSVGQPISFGDIAKYGLNPDRKE